MNALSVGLLEGMEVVRKTRSHRSMFIGLHTTRGVNASRIVRVKTHRQKL